MNSRSEKGVALLTIMVVIVILAGFTTTMMVEAGRRSMETTDLGAAYEAQNAAQSVGALALADLIAQGNGRIGTAGWDLTCDATPNNYPDPDESGVTPLRMGQAQVHAWADDGVLQADGKTTRHTLYAVGAVEARGRQPVTVVLRTLVDVKPPSVNLNVFNNATNGTSGIAPSTAGDNAQTDSYKSGTPGYTGTNGGMASNYGLELSGSAAIQGDLYAGGAGGVDLTFGGSVTGDVQAVGVGDVAYSDRSQIGGDILDGAAPQPAPPVKDRSADFVVNNNGLIGGITSVHLSGHDTLTLPPGKYLFDSVSVTSGPLTIQAPSEIYVVGTFKVSGQGSIELVGADPDNPVEILLASGGQITGQGFVNTGATPKPGDLMIYSHGTDEIKLAGSATMYAGVYAPNAPIKVTGSIHGDFYGALVGSTVDLSGNAFIHYDEDMPALNPRNVVAVVPAGTPYETTVYTWSRLR